MHAAGFKQHKERCKMAKKLRTYCKELPLWQHACSGGSSLGRPDCPTLGGLIRLRDEGNDLDLQLTGLTDTEHRIGKVSRQVAYHCASQSGCCAEFFTDKVGFCASVRGA